MFSSKFYRGDLLISHFFLMILRPRSSTPSLCKDPLKTRELLSEEDLVLKQNKADELRNVTVMKRLQLTSARRNRFEKHKTELVELKNSKIESRKEKEEKAVENKTKLDAEKVEVCILYKNIYIFTCPLTETFTELRVQIFEVQVSDFLLLKKGFDPSKNSSFHSINFINCCKKTTHFKIHNILFIRKFENRARNGRNVTTNN